MKHGQTLLNSEQVLWFLLSRLLNSDAYSHFNGLLKWWVRFYYFVDPANHVLCFLFRESKHFFFLNIQPFTLNQIILIKYKICSCNHLAAYEEHIKQSHCQNEMWTPLTFIRSLGWQNSRLFLNFRVYSSSECINIIMTR